MVIVKVSKFTSERNELVLPKLADQFKLSKLEFRPTKVSFEIHGVPVEIANGIRRTSIDEVKQYALEVHGFSCDDAFIIPNFVTTRIEFIPLCQDIGADVVSRTIFSLDIFNHNAFPINVYAGDLQTNHKISPIFNPTSIICRLAERCHLKIDKIIIREGIGSKHAKFNGMCCAALKPLDIPEIPNYIGPNSGYTIDSAMANPQEFRISGIIRQSKNAKKEAKRLYMSACTAIQHRLMRVVSAINKEQSSIIFIQIENKVIIQIPHETNTIGHIICKSVFDKYGDKIEIINFIIAAHEENMLTLQMRTVEKWQSDAATILTESITSAIATLTSISDQIAKF